MTRKHNQKFDICTVGLLTMILLKLIYSVDAALNENATNNHDNETEPIIDNISNDNINEIVGNINSNILTTTSNTIQNTTTIINDLPVSPVPPDIMHISDNKLHNQREFIIANNNNNNNNNISNTTSNSNSYTNNNDDNNSMYTSSGSSSSSGSTETSLSIISTVTQTTPIVIKPPSTSIVTTKLFTTSPYPELKHKPIQHLRGQYHSKHHHEHHLGPFFEEPLNASSGALAVGVHLATDAVLNCRVGMLKDKTVMWVRRTLDKFSLLTVGNVTYSGDPRIKITFQYPNNWRLHINNMQKEDAGIYMCQVSTHPPRVFATNVTVLPPAIRVVDEQGHEVRDRFYKIGSAINLTCQVATSYLINNSLSMSATDTNSLLHYPGISLKQNVIDIPPPSKISNSNGENFYKKIIWRKDGEELNRDVKINISSTTGWLNSRLSILSAERTHSGVFSCSILNSTSAIVQVQILNGETPAAVQHSLGQKQKLNGNIFMYLFQIIISIMLYISSSSC